MTRYTKSVELPTFKLKFGKDPELVSMAFELISDRYNNHDYDRDEYLIELSIVVYQFFKKGSARRLVRLLKAEPERTLGMLRK